MIKRTVKAGFLPLYIKLYDDYSMAWREPCLGHMEASAKALEAAGIEVVKAPICRTADEFRAEAEKFKAAGIDVLVTLHLAYSPSLESIDAIGSLGVPVVVLDSTPDYDFMGSFYTGDIINANHGIHGVQDMCNLLTRRGIPYAVEAGQLDNSDVIDRVVRDCKLAVAAKNFHTIGIGSVGGAFKGMGDFSKTPEELKADFGQHVEVLEWDVYRRFYDAVTDEEVNAEIGRTAGYFYQTGEIDSGVRASVVRTGLALKHWMQANDLNAFTVNFFATGSNGIHKMPFAPISVMMSEDGIGYAGEGDTLTAGLVGAMHSMFEDTTFTEMFCPDWKNGLIFLSHMGEMNLKIADGKAWLRQSAFKWSDAGDTLHASARYKAGNAVFINLAPRKEGYVLIATPVKMQTVYDDDSVYRGEVRGWMRPCMKVEKFLTEFSNLGGTHHSCLVYDLTPEDIVRFGRFAGLSVEVIDGGRR